MIGVVGTLGLSRLLTTFLYGVSAVDPMAFTAASLLLLAVGVLAALRSARARRHGRSGAGPARAVMRR